MKKQPSHILIGLGMGFVALGVHAEDTFKHTTFVGAGLSTGQSVFSDNGARLGLEPYLFHHSEYGFIDGSLANLTLLPWVGISGNVRIAEVSDDFDDIPDGINNRDSNGELGITIGTLGARLTYLHDVTDQHNGYEIQLHLGQVYDTPFDRWYLSPYVQINYRDAKLSDYLYSISPSESEASGLPAFSSDDTWVYQAGVINLYDFTDSLLGIAKLEFEHHDNDSPLVQHDLSWKVSMGATYRF